MHLSLGFISRHIPFPVLDFSSDCSKAKYGEVQWILPGQRDFAENVLYVTDRTLTADEITSGAGFVVVGEVPNEITFSTAEILAIGPSYSPADVLREISRLFERYRDYELRLSRLIYKPDGLVEICKLFFEILKCPACFTNANFKVLAYYGDQDSYEASYVWSHVVTDGFWPYPEVQKLIANDMERRFESPGHPVLMRTSDVSFPFIRLPIFLDDRCQGYFFVHSILRALGDDDVEVVDSLRSYLTEAFLNDPSSVTPKNFKYEHFILDVISGNITDKEILRKRMSEIGLEPDGEFSIILLETRKLNNRLPEILLRELYLFQGCTPFLDNGDVRAIVQAHDQDNHLKLIEKMTALAKRFDCKLSASERFHGIWNASIYSTQADLAMRFEPETGYSDRCRLFEEVYFDALVGLIADRTPFDPEVFINRHARLLSAYEDSGSFDYINTLRTYVLCQGNSLRASEMLHIHRSSLSYRLQKISAICDLDIDDYNAMFQTAISLSILAALHR